MVIALLMAQQALCVCARGIVIHGISNVDVHAGRTGSLAAALDGSVVNRLRAASQRFC
jgi:hypothetical protein